MAEFLHNFDEPRRISIVAVVGEATEAEWLTATSQFPQTSRLLFDLRRSRVATLDSGQLTIIGHAIGDGALASTAPVAVVAERDADYGVARRWSALLALPGV